MTLKRRDMRVQKSGKIDVVAVKQGDIASPALGNAEVARARYSAVFFAEIPYAIPIGFKCIEGRIG